MQTKTNQFKASEVTMNLHSASEDVMQLMLSPLISTCLSIGVISRISHKAPSISHLYLKPVIPLWKGLSAGSYHSAYHISAFTLCNSQDCVMGGRKKHGLQLPENIKIQLSQALALSRFCDWALCKFWTFFFFLKFWFLIRKSEINFFKCLKTWYKNRPNSDSDCF